MPEYYLETLSNLVLSRITSIDSQSFKSRTLIVAPQIIPPALASQGRESLVQLVISEDNSRGLDGTVLIKTVNLFIGAFVSYTADDPGNLKLADKKLQNLCIQLSTGLHEHYLLSSSGNSFYWIVCPIKEVTPFGVTEHWQGQKNFIYKMGQFQVDVAFPTIPYANRDFTNA